MRANNVVQIAVLLPDLLGTYGDRGNATVFAQRLRWRGQPAEIVEIASDEPVPGSCDLYVLGGGEDIAELEAIRVLRHSAFPGAVDRKAVVLAVCAGVQILGTSGFDTLGVRHPGLGLLDLTTRPRQQRAIGEITARPLQELGGGHEVLTGFENHGGATDLAPSTAPLARVLTGVGNGDGHEGVLTSHIVGTYLHGPVLARNPSLADHLLCLAIGGPLGPLPLEDVETLRDTTTNLARTRRPTYRRIRTRLTPRRWLSPGLSHGRSKQPG